MEKYESGTGSKSENIHFPQEFREACFLFTFSLFLKFGRKLVKVQVGQFSQITVSLFFSNHLLKIIGYK